MRLFKKIIDTLTGQKAKDNILVALLINGTSYGTDLVQVGAAKEGSVYGWLHQLEEEGLVESDEVGRGGIPRRAYWLTVAGEARARVLRGTL